MYNKKIKIGLLSILIFVLSISTYKIVTFNNIKKIIKVDFLEKGIDIKFDNAHIMQDNNNSKDWELKTVSATLNRKDNITYLKDMKMKIYPSESEMFNITAKDGKILKNEDMEMSGDIQIENKDYKLLTESLIWLKEKREIRSDAFVTIKGSRFDINGVGLILDIKTKTLTLKNKVKATIKL